MRKELGKITSAEFGSVSDYPFLVGLILSFGGDGWGEGDGGRYTVNIGDACKWSSPTERQETIAHMVDQVNAILTAAKVDSVSGLTGKPVEVTFDGNMFKDFRILTEVL